MALAAVVACSPQSEPIPETDIRPDLLARIEADLQPVVVIEGVERAPVTLAERMDDLGVPALSAAMWSGREIVWARAWGLADVESGRAATPETLFQAASISKPVASMGLLALVDDGLVDLDQDVNERLVTWKVPPDDLTEASPVTLRRLLSHTAGTTVHGFPGYARDAQIPSTVGVLDGEGNTDPVRVDIEPGTEMRYSGGGYTIAQLLASDVSDRPFAELLSEKVLMPLGMTASSYEQPLTEARWGRAATGYRSDKNAVEGGWHVYPEMAAAGLWTTPTDLAHFALSIQQARSGGEHPVLSKEPLDAMLEPQLEDYGLGLRLIDKGAFFGHGGANEGFRCNLIAELEGDSGVAIMTNSDRGDLLAQELLLSIAREVGWKGFQSQVKRVVTLPAATLEALVGRYSTEGPPGAVEIYLEDGQIWARPQWGGVAGQLLPESETRLFDAEDGRQVDVVWAGGAVRTLKARGLEFHRVD